MRGIYKNKIWSKLLLTAMICFCCSCQQDEDLPGIPTPQPEGTDPVVTLEVRIPGLLLPSAETYGMPAATETKINELTLLAYQDVAGAKQLKIKQQLTAANFTQVGNNLTATLTITQGKYDKVVLIANANIQAATLAFNSNYTALNNLEIVNTTGQWGTTGTSYIPMSATLDATVVNGLDITNSRTFKGLKLTRMLAKVDIINAATGTFTLKNVYIYNTSKNGTIVADKATYGATPKRERLPAAHQKDGTPRNFDFAALSQLNGTKREMTNEIYIMEAAKADITSAATAKASTRIVLYGQYGTQYYYYPVDFTYSTTAGTITKGDFMPVIRNHHYTFEITKVSGAGFTTANAAMEYQGTYTNIEVKLHQIDDDYTDVYYDAGTYLAVNSTNVNIMMGLGTYNSATDDNTISVLTNAANFTIEIYNTDGTLAAPAKMKPDADSYVGGGTAKDAYLIANYVSTATTNEFEGYLIVKANGLQSDKIPLYKLWCGKNGIPLTQTIGINKYKTHRYPTGTGAVQQCWMVENSKEGIGSSKGYGLNWNGGTDKPISAPSTEADRGKVNGYYYSWTQATQANNACPTGWSLPSSTQWDSMVSLINATAVNTDPIAIWWSGARIETQTLAFAGLRNAAGSSWANWGEYGYWWTTTVTPLYRANNAMMSKPNFNWPGALISVRCTHN